MGNVAFEMHQEPEHRVEVIVHVDETLSEAQRDDLTGYLTSTEGVNTAEFCPLRYHLMLVQYDRDLINSQDVLGRVQARDIHAELIGPV
jgi:hypothetical protein